MRKGTPLTAALLTALVLCLAPTGLEAVQAQLQFVGLLHDTSLVGGTQFSAQSLRDLMIVVEYRNLSGTHTQRIHLYSPDGALYQRLSSQVTSAAQVPNQRVETRLPVGGTWITEHSLFGAWRVEVYLDREEMPVTTEVFTLTP